MRAQSRFNLDALEVGVSKFWFNVVTDNIGNNISIPVVVIKSAKPGPIFTITSLIHGDELNGLDVSHSIIKEVEQKLLKGTIIILPVFNTPGFLKRSRYFDGVHDLNYFMPGKRDGKLHEVYVQRIFSRIIKKSTYLLDLHTARSGSHNIYYVRANLALEKTKKVALLLGAKLVLDHLPSPTTLRGAAENEGVTALTLELGNPLRYQKIIIDEAAAGILRVLKEIKMLRTDAGVVAPKMIICKSSHKISSESEGIAEIFPRLLDRVKKGERIGVLKDLFGEVKEEFFADEGGVVIGKLSNPMIEAGRSIIHIGKIMRGKTL